MATRITKVSDETKGRNVLIYDADGYPIAPFEPSSYDYIQLNYTGTKLSSVTYRSGGVTGTIVGTLTLGYTSGKITSVART